MIELRTIFKYKFYQLFNPLLQALHNLSGSDTSLEIEKEVARIMNLTNEELIDVHRGNRTKLRYRLAWAKNYLTWYGLLRSPARGVWSLTPKGTETTSVNEKDVLRYREQNKSKK